MDSLFKNLQRNTIKRIESGEFITGDSSLLEEEIKAYHSKNFDESGFVEKVSNVPEVENKSNTDDKKVDSVKNNKDGKLDIVISNYDIFDKLRNTNSSDYKNMTVYLLELYLMGELDRISSLRLPKNTMDKIVGIMEEFPKMVKSILKEG